MHHQKPWQQRLPYLLPQIKTKQLTRYSNHTLSPQHCCILLRGRARIFSYPPQDHLKPLFLGHIYAGDWLTSPLSSDCYMKAGETDCRFLEFNAAQTQLLQSQCSDFRQRLHASLLKQNNALFESLSVYQLSVEDRLVTLLQKLFSKHRQLHYSHAELASMIGSSRETVSRQLAQWQKEGKIDTYYRCIKPLDNWPPAKKTVA